VIFFLAVIEYPCRLCGGNGLSGEVPEWAEDAGAEGAQVDGQQRLAAVRAHAADPAAGRLHDLVLVHALGLLVVPAAALAAAAGAISAFQGPGAAGGPALLGQVFGVGVHGIV
jgi:hypothetical protein